MLLTPHYRGHLAMLTFSLLVAGSFSFGTRIANLMEPAAVTAARFLIAGCIVGAIAFATVGFNKKHYQAPWRYLLLGGVFAFYFAFMFEGLKTTNPISAAAIFTLTPAMSAVFAYFLLSQRSNSRTILALLVGGAGALIVIFRGDLSALVSFKIGKGEQIYFVACIAHALYTPMVPKLNRGEPAVVFTFGMIVAGSLVLLTFGAKDLAQAEWSTLPPLFWIALFYLAIFASACTFFLLQYASIRLPSANVMAYTYLTPIWVMFVELIITSSAPNSFVWVGLGLTVIALLMLLRRA